MKFSFHRVRGDNRWSVSMSFRRELAGLYSIWFRLGRRHWFLAIWTNGYEQRHPEEFARVKR